MNLHLQEILEGFNDTVNLVKAGENIFEQGNHALFPNIDSQQKWRYARANNQLRLSDGQQVYAFNAPEGEKYDEEFPLERAHGGGLHDFEAGATSKGLAQVHRADPGHIYFTIQEGKQNPTFTFRHVGADKWKGIPKTKKKKNVTEGLIPLHENPQQQQQGLEGAGQRPMMNPMEHTPGHNQPAIGGGMDNALMHNVNPHEVKRAFEEMLAKEAALSTDLGDSLVHGGMLPGRNPLGAGLAGGLGGLGYHLLKKNSITQS